MNNLLVRGEQSNKPKDLDRVCWDLHTRIGTLGPYDDHVPRDELDICIQALNQTELVISLNIPFDLVKLIALIARDSNLYPCVLEILIFSYYIQVDLDQVIDKYYDHFYS